jgi:hypothetical protein
MMDRAKKQILEEIADPYAPQRYHEDILPIEAAVFRELLVRQCALCFDAPLCL